MNKVYNGTYNQVNIRLNPILLISIHNAITLYANLAHVNVTDLFIKYKNSLNCDKYKTRV